MTTTLVRTVFFSFLPRRDLLPLMKYQLSDENCFDGEAQSGENFTPNWQGCKYPPFLTGIRLQLEVCFPPFYPCCCSSDLSTCAAGCLFPFKVASHPFAISRLSHLWCGNSVNCSETFESVLLLKAHELYDNLTPA